MLSFRYVRHDCDVSCVLAACALLWLAGVAVSAAEPEEVRPASAWLEIASDETRQQLQWEAHHPDQDAILTGAGQFVVAMYGQAPTAAFIKGSPEFIAWWKATGATQMEQWASAGFPMLVDPDHMMLNAMALYCAASTGRSNTAIYINGTAFANPTRFWAYYDGLIASGNELLKRGYAGEPLSRHDFELLRLFTPLVYCMWSGQYLPHGLHLTAGDMDHYPVPGMTAPDFTLPRLLTFLKSPGYTDAYAFDYKRPFHSEMADFLLNICAGYQAIPEAKRVPGGPLITARPYNHSFPDDVTLSAARGKRPVLLVFSDPIDGYWSTTIPIMEPLYQATKDRVDWYFVCDDIADNIYWSDYFFKPSQRSGQVMQKVITMQERAQLAKMVTMRYVNMSFPLLLDDMAQHAQDAYTDGGGIAKVILIDKNGIIALNNRLFDQPRNYMEQGDWGYRKFIQVHAVVAANIASLLDHRGIWNGTVTMPDWQPPSSISNVKITALDPTAGTFAATAADGAITTFTVDAQSRIVNTISIAHPLLFNGLALGCTVSLTYVTTADGRKLAGLILIGAPLNDYITNSVSYCTDRLWCPAIARSFDGRHLQASLSPRPRSEITGLKFWEDAGASAVPQGLGWMIPVVKDWADHPDQKLSFTLDRATEILVNGMHASLSDIHPGDHLGIEIRPEQPSDDRRPFVVYVYRFAADHDAAASTASGTK